MAFNIWFSICAIEMMAMGIADMTLIDLGQYLEQVLDNRCYDFTGTLSKTCRFARRLYDPDDRAKMVNLYGKLCKYWRDVPHICYSSRIDRIVPVDIYLPGCAPRPETLQYALMMLQKKVRRDSADMKKNKKQNLRLI